MRIKQGKLHHWAYACTINYSEPYNHCVMEFTEVWADEMEKCLDNGETIEQCAERSSRIVNKRPGFGITGFMYGCAIALLADVWECGEDLRIWHNLNIQIGHEGEQANVRGTVLNPAMFCIGGNNEHTKII